MQEFAQRVLATFAVVLAAGLVLTMLSYRAWFISPYLSDNALLVGALVSLGSLLMTPVSSSGSARASIVSPRTAKYSRISRGMVRDTYFMLASALAGTALAFTASIILETLGLIS